MKMNQVQRQKIQFHEFGVFTFGKSRKVTEFRAQVFNFREFLLDTCSFHVRQNARTKFHFAWQPGQPHLRELLFLKFLLAISP